MSYIEDLYKAYDPEVNDDLTLRQAFYELDITRRKPGVKLGSKVNTEKARKWHDICSKCFPSDEIILDTSTMAFLDTILIRMGFGSIENTYTIPDDIVVSKNVPLPNIILRTDTETERSYRFVLDGDDLYLVDGWDNARFGAPVFMINRFLHHDHYYSTDFEEVYVSNNQLDPHNTELSVTRKIRLMDLYKTRYSFATVLLRCWYAIQVLLLHPNFVKSDILKRDRKVKISENKLLLKKHTKRKAYYIKRETINADIFKRKEFSRKTMCWYVIGHYRKHGDGKTWVNGYWKGPLRNAKQNLDNGRERVIKGV